MVVVCVCLLGPFSFLGIFIIDMKPLPSPLTRMRPTLVHFLAFLQVTVQPMDVKADWVLINGLVNLFNLPDLSMGNKMTGDIAEAIKPLIEYAKMWSASDGGANFFDDLAISSIVIHLSFSLRGEVFQPPTDPLDIDDPKDERPHHHHQVTSSMFFIILLIIITTHGHHQGSRKFYRSEAQFYIPL